MFFFMDVFFWNSYLLHIKFFIDSRISIKRGVVLKLQLQQTQTPNSRMCIFVCPDKSQGYLGFSNAEISFQTQ